MLYSKRQFYWTSSSKWHNNDIEKFSLELKNNGIKNIKLQVSAPFHCKLMESLQK